MAETLNATTTTIPKAASNGGQMVYSTPDRGDGKSAVVTASSKADAKDEIAKLHKKYSKKPKATEK